MAFSYGRAGRLAALLRRFLARAVKGFAVDRRQMVLDPLGTLSPLLEQMQAEEDKDTISGWSVLENTGEEFVTGLVLSQ
jgi:hypothetical protein